MKLTFHGAARSVTGSAHLLEVGGRQVLLECGLFQGRRAEANRRNRELPFEASQVSACVLSHAHIDHSGNLPNLVKSGFRGKIYATRATVDLARVLLMDSAYLQQKDADYLNRRAKREEGRKRAARIEPIYTREHVEATNRRFKKQPYGKPFNVAPGVRCTFLDAGHILGSAISYYELEEQGRRLRLGFTGDLGRPRHPILRDPQRMPRVDYLISESTYGNRLHEAAESMKDKLRQIVTETTAKGGRLIIPAFSVGRTQNLVYTLAELFEEGTLPPVKVFVDSPLAIDATRAYRDHPECYDAETRELIENGTDPFGFKRLTYTRDPEESKALNALDEPCVVISASGMCEGGRILHHLKHGLEKPENTILIVGYQAEHTLGRRILDGKPTVKVYGREVTVRATIKKLNGFSAHADRDELATYIKHIPGLKRVFVVHGEEEASFSLAAYLMQLGIKAHVPTLHETIEL